MAALRHRGKVLERAFSAVVDPLESLGGQGHSKSIYPKPSTKSLRFSPVHACPCDDSEQPYPIVISSSCVIWLAASKLKAQCSRLIAAMSATARMALELSWLDLFDCETVGMERWGSPPPITTSSRRPRYRGLEP